MNTSLSHIQFPLLIDGGLSNQLESQGCDLNHPLWTAKLIQEDPQAVIEAHLAYLNAGAKCIATMSYQASRMGYEQIGIDNVQADELIIKSVDLAAQAVGIFMKEHPQASKPLIAASMGPYGAALADGSEYRGDYEVTKAHLEDFHLPRIQLLAASQADLLAFETIPSILETEVLAEITQDIGKPFWASFSCINGKSISDGTPIRTAVEVFKNSHDIFAIGVNCTAPKHIGPLIDEIKATGWTRHIIVYPNLGKVYNVDTKVWEEVGEEQVFGVDLVQQWLEQGADVIGGCCQVGPDDIRALDNLI